MKFLSLLQEASMDCSIHSKDKCECFQLPDQKYFDNDFQIYQADYQNDLAIQVGTFAQGTKTLTQQAFLIEFINRQSAKQKGYLNYENNIVYDEKYLIPISEIKSFNGFRIKNEQGLYYDKNLSF